MTVRKLIQMLEAHAAKHGDDAQIAVYSPVTAQGPGERSHVVCREEAWVNRGNVSTTLESRGAEIQW